MRIEAAIRLLRPSHVIKNLFVLLPAPFAAAEGHPVDWSVLVLGFLAFSCVPAGMYAVNDVFDARRDRAHPRKRRRPVAAEEFVPAAALTIGASAIALGLGGLALVAEGRGLFLGAIYVVLFLYYSVRGKHIPIIDLALLICGFLLRIALGCRLIGVFPAHEWLVCGSLVALFLALGKRRGDLVAGVGEAHRPSLAGYSLSFIDRAMEVALAAALIAYALYARSSAAFVPDRRYAGVLFAALGLLCYLRRARREDETRGPVDLLVHSPEILASLVGYAVATAWSLDAFP